MNIVVVGFGTMGKRVVQTIEKKEHMKLLMVVDASNYQDIAMLQDPIDVFIDFSHPNNLAWISEYIKIHHTAYICGTTGYKDYQVKQLEELSKVAPIVYTANFSLGIAVFQQVLKMMTPILEESFDIEVIEKHHNQKVDAPSGTAKLLLATMNKQHTYKEVHGRNGMIGKRQKEIGVHAIRGGTVAGEHSVLFLGEDESFEITHTATSKQIFVNGAMQAAQFIVGKAPGLYTMDEILFQ